MNNNNHEDQHTVPSGKTILMICKSCGGTLTLQEDRPILMCPFCGSNELILENDAVTIERIRNKTIKEIEVEKIKARKEIEFERNQVYKEIEREKILAQNRNVDLANEAKKMEYKSALYADDKEAAQKFKHSFTSKAIIILLPIFFLGICLDYDKATKLIAVGQCFLCVLAWLIGYRGIKIRIPGLPQACLVLAILLFFQYVYSGEYNEKLAMTYTWPDTGLLSMLPEPDSKSGEIGYDNSDAEIYGCTKEQFDNYCDQCKKNGFSYNISEYEDHFSAYNEDNYEVSLSYEKFDKEIQIYMFEPRNY